MAKTATAPALTEAHMSRTPGQKENLPTAATTPIKAANSARRRHDPIVILPGTQMLQTTVCSTHDTQAAFVLLSRHVPPTEIRRRLRVIFRCGYTGTICQWCSSYSWATTYFILTI